MNNYISDESKLKFYYVFFVYNIISSFKYLFTIFDLLGEDKKQNIASIYTQYGVDMSSFYNFALIANIVIILLNVVMIIGLNRRKTFGWITVFIRCAFIIALGWITTIWYGVLLSQFGVSTTDSTRTTLGFIAFILTVIELLVLVYFARRKPIFCPNFKAEIETEE